MDNDKSTRDCCMDSLTPEYTGVSNILFVSGKTAKQKPRIKVALESSLSPNRPTVSISIENNPKLLAGDLHNLSSETLEKIKEWIVLNQDVLFDYWNYKISTHELINKIKRL